MKKIITLLLAAFAFVAVHAQTSKEEARKVILETLAASAHGEIAKRGPRGGKRWLPRYFVRRVAWHVLDHMWELEDRV